MTVPEKDTSFFRDILIVDDTKENLSLLKNTLNSAGYSVRPAPSADLALRSIKIKAPDLILLDIRMPQMSGYDLCKLLKADKQTENIPIIFISALNDSAEMVKAFEVGGVDYVTKPFKAELVLARVSLHLSMSRMRYQLQAQNEELLHHQSLLEKRVTARTAELQSALEKADAANSAKSEFLAAMSHDLRTPLNAVLGFSEMMQHQVFGPLGDERYASYVDDIHRSAKHLLALVEDVLDLSKVEAGKFSLSDEYVDCEDAIESVVSMLSQLAREKNIEVTTEVTTTDLLCCDERVLRQILANLLSNALKFSPNDSSIQIKCKSIEEGAIDFCIEDHGVGIEPEQIPQILNPYEQINSKHSRKTGGTGLGLYLTKTFIELHEGEIAIESEPGQGTKVCVVFPSHRTIAKH